MYDMRNPDDMRRENARYKAEQDEAAMVSVILGVLGAVFVIVAVAVTVYMFFFDPEF